jgi:ribonuclease P protein subunit POP4
VEITPSKLIFHELIGLFVEVVDATNPSLISISGKVVDETKNMIIILTKADSKKLVPKAGTTFVFRIPARLSGEHAVKHVKIDGNLLVSQPENRTKNIKKIRMR